MRRTNRQLLAAVFAATLILIVGLAQLSSGETRLPANLTAELADAGIQVTATTSAGMVSRETALASMHEAFGDTFDAGDLGAYLVELSDPATFVDGARIKDRPIWLIVVSGLSLPAPAPIQADGTPADVPPATRAYIYVDAATGDWLGTWTTNQEEFREDAISDSDFDPIRDEPGFRNLMSG